jgi:S-sulfo-L-cysteine synthase (O-acetyl-L-serine-dependent)
MTTLSTATRFSVSPVQSQRQMIDHVGNTPLIPLNRITSALPATVKILAKAEWFNPSGSVKDRPASGIINYALSNGHLSGGKTLLDSTSGNMGIAYATLGAALGIPIHLTIAANASAERLMMLKALGVELTLTDPLEGSDGAREVADQLARQHPDRYYYADQYSHPENWRTHFRTTGPEVLSQTMGEVTHFLAGMGTSGTMMGAGGFLKEQLPNMKLLAVQPDGPLHGLEGLKHLETSPHPEIFNPSLADRTLPVSTENAYAMARRLAQEEGLLVGFSAAAAAWAALEHAQTLDHGTLVVIFPDSAMKYLNNPFWSGKE